MKHVSSKLQALGPSRAELRALLSQKHLSYQHPLWSTDLDTNKSRSLHTLHMHTRRHVLWLMDQEVVSDGGTMMQCIVSYLHLIVVASDLTSLCYD